MWKLGIITVAEIIHIVSELGKENKIVGNKSEEDLAAVLADTLCFADTFLFVRIIFQMIKRAEQKDNIKRLRQCRVSCRHLSNIFLCSER